MDESFDFVVIGAGIAGSALFYHLSKIGRILLLDKKPNNPTDPLLKVFPKHNFLFFSELQKSNSELFLKDHNTTMYASNSIESIINALEFGSPFGKIIDQSKLTKWLQDQGITNHGEILWNKLVTEIISYSDKVEIKIRTVSTQDQVDIIQSNVVIIASGSSGLDLQKQTGFSIPEVLNTIVWIAHGNKDQLQQAIPIDYEYRLHPKISTTGPFVITHANEIVNIGFISNEPFQTMLEKFRRILLNYSPLQKLIPLLDKNPNDLLDRDFIMTTCAKNVIPNKIKNRVLIIGEAAGLVTSVYYEGIVGCLASAQAAAETLTSIYHQQGNFSEKELINYESRLHHKIKNYFQAAQVTELLFLKSGPNQFTIWNSFLECIQKYPQLRKNIHYAYICENIGEYPLDHDIWAGEQIYKNLNFTQKLILAPLFLRAKFT